METHFFECECMSDEHVFKFVYDPTENELYLSVHIRDWQPWWKRVWIAVKYVFGYKSKYGEWDTVIFQPRDAIRLRNILNTFESGAPGKFKTYYLTVDSPMTLEQVQLAVENAGITVDKIHKGGSAK